MINKSDLENSENRKSLNSVFITGIKLKKGDKVVLHPDKESDAFDPDLEGKTAFIESIEQFNEDNVRLEVSLEDAQNSDTKQSENRFIVALREVEPFIFAEKGA